MGREIRDWNYCETRFGDQKHRHLINQVSNQRLIPSTDVIQLTLTLKMTTPQVVETSVTVNNNSPIQDYVHPDDHIQSAY